MDFYLCVLQNRSCFLVFDLFVCGRVTGFSWWQSIAHHRERKIWSLQWRGWQAGGQSGTEGTRTARGLAAGGDHRPGKQPTRRTSTTPSTRAARIASIVYFIAGRPLANMSFPYAYHSLSVLFSAFNTSDMRFCEEIRPRSLNLSLCLAPIDGKKISAW